MSRIKLIVAALAAVVAVSAVASGVASAATAGWMVNGTLLNGSAKLATTAKVDSNGLVLESASVTLNCTTFSGVNPTISSPAMGLASSLVFGGCSIVSPATCELDTETISSVPVLVEATLDGALAVKATFTPETKTTFATIQFLGASCPLLGTQPVTGKAEVLAPEGQDERTVQIILAINSAGSLKIGSGEAKLLGASLLQLEHGETWSFL